MGSMHAVFLNRSIRGSVQASGPELSNNAASAHPCILREREREVISWILDSCIERGIKVVNPQHTPLYILRILGGNARGCLLKK